MCSDDCAAAVLSPAVRLDQRTHAVTNMASCPDLIKPSSEAQSVSSSMQCSRVCIMPSVKAPNASLAFLTLYPISTQISNFEKLVSCDRVSLLHT